MFKVDEAKCTGCEVCVNVCPTEAISMVNDKARIDGEKCIDCGRCVQVCPQEAIYYDVQTRQNFPPNQEQNLPDSGFSMGAVMGRGLGRGMGRGLRRGPRDGRGQGRGGGGGRR
jgi:NAD-dependent dihydropyrimidine dehydrogenase PreA subunit